MVSGDFSSGFSFLFDRLTGRLRHISQVPLWASFRYSKREFTLCYYRQFGRVVHCYLFSYHWGFTTFFYHGYKITTVPAGKHPTSNANLGAFDDSASASVDLVDEFSRLLEMCGEVTLKELGSGFG